MLHPAAAKVSTDLGTSSELTHYRMTTLGRRTQLQSIGFHPLPAWCSSAGESLAVMNRLRLGRLVHRD